MIPLVTTAPGSHQAMLCLKKIAPAMKTIIQATNQTATTRGNRVSYGRGTTRRLIANTVSPAATAIQSANAPQNTPSGTGRPLIVM